VLALARHRQTVVWIGLVFATMLAWGLSADHAFDGDTARRLATCGVLLVAFVKVRFVGLHFMELGHAPRVLRGCFDAWVIVVLVTLVALYLTGG
jgi:hypothetical protein